MIKRHRSTAERYLAKFSLGLLLVVMLGWGGLYFTAMRPVAKGGELQRFEVKKGESVRGIAENLKQAGLIRSPLYFRYLVKANKLTLQAGIYQIDPAALPTYIAQTLTNGKDEGVKITIPEGYRIEQIAEVLEKNLGRPASEFTKRMKGLEGKIFPDTYFFDRGSEVEVAVKKMNANFEAKVGQVDQATLVLASLIERETKNNEEKTIVAGIIKKRLAADWPLELDATIQYWLGKPGDWWPHTTLADRQINSPYNTYLNRGLPPNPICNPGLIAIDAARNPADSPYWFYLHDREGQIHYAVSASEHNLNIDKYLR